MVDEGKAKEIRRKGQRKFLLSISGNEQHQLHGFVQLLIEERSRAATGIQYDVLIDYCMRKADAICTSR